jgi:hypothetical protein
MSIRTRAARRFVGDVQISAGKVAKGVRSSPTTRLQAPTRPGVTRTGPGSTITSTTQGLTPYLYPSSAGGGGLPPGGYYGQPNYPTWGQPGAYGFTGAPPPGGGLGFDPCASLPSYLQGVCRAGADWLEQNIGGGQQGNGQQPACKDGAILVNGKCVAPGDAFPGGDPFITGAGGQTTMGGFGLPAVTPTEFQRRHLHCPRGMVLGRDELCYPKGLLPRRSNYRKWKGAKRPPISAKQASMIRGAKSAQDKIKELAQDAGFKVSKKGSSRRKK